MSGWICFFGYAYKNGIILYFDGICLDILARGAAYYFAGMHIELSAVPGTNKDVTIEIALVQRAADMGAVVSEGTDITIHSCQANRFAIDFCSQQRTFFQFIEFCYFNKICHKAFFRFPLLAEGV